LAQVSGHRSDEIFRVCCPKCGLKVEQVPQLPTNVPFSKGFEDAAGLACESAAARQVARQFQLPASTVRAIDLRYLERWNKSRKKPVLQQMGVDEIHLGKTQKFLTVVSNLETGEPLWFGKERKKETLDDFFRNELSAMQRGRITAECRIVYDKFHVMQDANQALDLSLRRSGAALSQQVDRPIAVATAGAIQEAGRHVTPASGRNPELLPLEGAVRSRGSGQRKH